MFDLVVTNRVNQQNIMSSSDSDSENWDWMPGEYSPEHWEHWNDDPSDSSSSDSDTSDRDSSNRDSSNRCSGMDDEDGIPPGVCKVCLCDLPDCECAEQFEKHQRYLAYLRRNRRNNVSRRRFRKKTRRNVRDAKRGGKSTQNPALRTKPKVQPKQKKLAEPQVQPKQEGTTTSDHSYDHHLDQSDDDSHKTDTQKNH